MKGPFSVAISGNGASVYVADNTSRAIDAFSRNTSTGALTFMQCIGQLAGCTTTGPAQAVNSPVSVAVSPDGTNVYAGSNAAGGVDVFSRDTTTGVLTFRSCIGTLSGCAHASPLGAVGASYGDTVSPDGANVYSGDGGNVLSTFSRTTGSGELTFTGCVGQLAGCATTSPAGAVETPVSVTVSPDGGSVYVPADGANAVDVFSPAGGGGALTFTGCVGQLTGCAATTPAGAAGGSQSVAVTPDGASVYAVSLDSNTVEEYVRSLATCSDITAAVPFATAQTLALTCSDLDGDPLSYAITGGPAHGTLGPVSPSGQVTYTPPRDSAAPRASPSRPRTRTEPRLLRRRTSRSASRPRPRDPIRRPPPPPRPRAWLPQRRPSKNCCSAAPNTTSSSTTSLSTVAGWRSPGAQPSTSWARKVKILFNERKHFATATILANGQYSTTAPLPPARIRENLTTRYTAVLGRERSLHLKLTRRLLLEPPKASGHTVTLTGQVTLPLTKPIAPIVIEQQLECGRTTIIKRITPPASGRFHITLTVPASAKAGIYRLKSSVAANTHATKHGFTTYSLPLPVVLG